MDTNEKIQLDDITLDDIISGKYPDEMIMSSYSL